MSSKLSAFRRCRRALAGGPGQGQLEYGLILVSVALVAIVAVFLFGARVGTLVSAAGSSIQ